MQRRRCATHLCTVGLNIISYLFSYFLFVVGKNKSEDFSNATNKLCGSPVNGKFSIMFAAVAAAAMFVAGCFVCYYYVGYCYNVCCCWCVCCCYVC